MNKLLLHQLREHFGGADKVPANFGKLLDVISESYDCYENDQEALKKYMELSSKEMTGLNSQLKNEKDELKKANKELKTVFEGIDEILYSVDMVSLKILQISDACEKVYGYTSAEFLADRDLWQKVILPGDIHIVHHHFKELYEGKQVMGQYRITHKDKSIRWLESKIIPTLDKNGQLLRLDGVTNDISERKRAAKDLEESVSLLEATIESTADGILVVDFNGRIVRFNKKFVELTRLPQEILDEKDDEKAIAFVLNQLINPEEFLSKVKELYLNPGDVSFDVLRFKDGRTIERHSQPQLIKGNCVGRVWSFRDTTERKQAEDKVIESELRYRALIEQSTDIICIVDTTLKFSDINPSGCRVFGYSKEEVLQLSLSDVLSKEELKSNPLKIEDLKSGKTLYNERRVKRKDGTILEIELSGKMLEDGRIMVFGRDISERKKAEQKLITTSGALQQALNDLNKIMDSSLDVICAVDEAGYFIQVSAACETIWGYKAEELIGKLMIDFVYPEDREKTQNAAISVIAGNNMINFENRYIRKDGSLVPINWSARWDPNDRIRYGVARDATEKKRSEEALEIQRQRYNELFLQAPSCIGVVRGPNHVYEMANPLYLRIIGKSDIVGKPVKEAIPEAVDQGLIEILDEVYKTGKAFSTTEMLVKLEEKDGTLSDVYLNSTCQAFRNNEGNVDGIFFFAVDVTEQVLSRKKIEESESRYRQIVETAQEGIWMIDENNVTTFVNKKMAEILEYSVEEMIGKKNYYFMDDEYQKKASEHIAKRKLGMSENHDFNYVAKSGRIVLTNLSTNPVFDDAGIYKGALAMVTDITERKNAEDKIKISELRYRSLVEQATDAICITDGSMKFIDINPYALGMFGYTMEEALQLSLPDILFAEDLAANPVKLSELKLGGTARNERRLKRKDGTAVDMAVSTKLMEDGSLIMFGHDITERNKSEEALRESEKRLRQIIDLVPHFIFAKDAKGKFILVNEAVATAYGSTVEGLIGKTDSDFNPKKEEVEYFIEEDLKVINSRNAKYNVEETITDSDGNIRILSTTKIPYTSPGAHTTGVLGVCVDITERKKAESVLKESEDQLTIATQIAKLGYWEFDVPNNLFKFNDQFYSIYKTTAEEAGGYTMSSEQYASLFVHPDDLTLLANETAKAIKSTDPDYTCQIEHRVKFPNAEIGYMAFRFFITKNELGRTIKVFGAIQDTTERKKAEEALTNNELRFRTLTSNAPVGIFQTDDKGKTIYVNETWLSYTGLTMVEALGDGWASAIHPDDRSRLLASWNDESQKNLKSSSEYRFVTKEGNSRWVSGVAIPLFNNAGDITGHIGTVSDITDRKNAEAILTKSERQLSIATQIAKLGYWELDIVNNLFTFTDQFYTIFKTTAEKAGGYTMTPEQYAEVFVYPDDRPMVGEQVAKAIHSADPFMSYHLEHRIVYATGEIGYISVHFYIVKDGEGRTIKTFGVNQDITDRKKGEETLLRSEAILEIKNEQLEQKNKELEQFAYVASHDMQEPLRTTSSFVELLQKQYKGKLDEKADKYLTFISQSSDRMKVLIKDLLDYSRIGRKTELAKVDCNVIVNEVLADLGKAITEANAEIKVDNLPVINGYPTEIKQLFQNLVINAIKFRKQNTIPLINICVLKKDSYWVFAVKDNGIGIDQQHKERIFIIFQRLHTRNEYEGSGIGLAHCKKIVELHGGKIWIESEPGEGSTFHFTIGQNNN